MGKLRVTQTQRHPCPQLGGNTTQTDKGVSARCHQENSSRLKCLRKHWDFFSTQKNFDMKMTNSLGGSKFPDVLQFSAPPVTGMLCGKHSPVGRRPTGKEKGSKQGRLQLTRTTTTNISKPKCLGLASFNEKLKSSMESRCFLTFPPTL